MTGTLVNIIAIIIGSSIGLLIGNRLPPKIQESVVTGLGLTTLVIGLQNAMGSGNIIIPLLSLSFGAIIGELIGMDDALKRFGGWLQTRAATLSRQDTGDLAQARARFINGFVTSSLVFCVGPMAILGSIQNGMNSGDIQLLAIKSTLDFFASIAFAASLGIGVAFSIIPTLVLQGGFALVGTGLVSLFTAGSATLTSGNPYIREMTATGGLILMGLALVLLNIKQPRVANFLPGLLIAPLLVLIANLLGIKVYPF